MEGNTDITLAILLDAMQREGLPGCGEQQSGKKRRRLTREFKNVSWLWQVSLVGMERALMHVWVDASHCTVGKGTNVQEIQGEIGDGRPIYRL